MCENSQEQQAEIITGDDALRQLYSHVKKVFYDTNMSNDQLHELKDGIRKYGEIVQNECERNCKQQAGKNGLNAAFNEGYRKGVNTMQEISFAERRDCDIELSGLRKENEKLASHIALLMASNAGLGNIIERLENELKQEKLESVYLRSKLDIHEQTKHYDNYKYGELKDRCSELSEKLLKATDENIALKASNEGLKNDIRAYLEEYFNIRKKMEDAYVTISALQREKNMPGTLTTDDVKIRFWHDAKLNTPKHNEKIYIEYLIGHDKTETILAKFVMYNNGCATCELDDEKYIEGSCVDFRHVIRWAKADGSY
jgi:hypothetical protein